METGLAIKRVFLLLVLLSLNACEETGYQPAANENKTAALQQIKERGQRMIATNDTSRLRMLADSLYLASKATGHRTGMAMALRFRAKQLEVAKKWEEVLVVAEENILLTEDRPELIDNHLDALYTKGDMAFKLGQFQSAFQCFFDARKLSKSADSCAVAFFDYRMGMVTYRQKNFARSCFYFQRALDNFRYCATDFQTDLRRQEIMSNIGLCFINEQMPDSALYWYGLANQLIDLMQPEGDIDRRTKQIAKAVIAGNEGVAFAKLGRLSEAKLKLQEEILINLQPGYDRVHLVYTVNELCEVLVKTGEIDELYRYLVLLDSLPELRANNFPTARFYHHLSQYHTRKGNRQEAILYVDSFLQHYDMVRREDRDLFRTDLDRSMRVLESEYQVNRLKQEAELNAQQNTYTLYLVIALLLLSLSAVYAYWSSQRRNAVLNSLNREKDKMMRVVAHDLRNPIAAVYSMSEMNLREGAKPDKEYWHLAKKACQGALDLIQEMLEVTHIRQGKNPLAVEWVSVNQLLSDTERLIQYRAAEKNVTLTFTPAQPDMEVLVVPEHMRRAISNLISNAIKFSNKDGAVQLQVKRNELGLLISVQDSGIGIPKNLEKKVFDSFTSARRAGTQGEAAFGLGLSIVKEIVTAHDGKVWFISSEGVGSTFFVQLPGSRLRL